MNRIYLPVAPLFLFACQTADSPKKADTPVVQTVQTVQSVAVDSTLILDRMIQRTKDLLPSAEVSGGYLLMGNGFDTLWTVLYHIGDLPLKLEYTTFEDGGAAAGTADYYFDSSGLCFAGCINYDGMVMVQGTIEGQVVEFRKTPDRESLPALGAEYTKLLTSKSVMEMMQPFPSINYKVLKSKPGTVLPLLVLKDMDVYAAPDTTAAVLCKVRKRERLDYVDAKPGSDIVNGRKWIWFKVNYKQYTGWVFGHPELVAEVNDEVY